MTGLKSLIIGFSLLSDEGLMQLTTLMNPESINVEGTDVTEAGIEKFQEKKSNVVITN